VFRKILFVGGVIVLTYALVMIVTDLLNGGDHHLVSYAFVGLIGCLTAKLNQPRGIRHQR